MTRFTDDLAAHLDSYMYTFKEKILHSKSTPNIPAIDRVSSPRQQPVRRHLDVSRGSNFPV